MIIDRIMYEVAKGQLYYPENIIPPHLPRIVTILYADRACLRRAARIANGYQFARTPSPPPPSSSIRAIAVHDVSCSSRRIIISPAVFEFC